MNKTLVLVLVACAVGGCSSSGSTDGGYDAGYCPPSQGMNMPLLCKNNDPCNTGTDLHIGAWCSPAGNQCAQFGLTCGIDADPVEGGYFCVKLCTLNSQCGEGACCTGDPMNENGGQRACVPNSCPDKFCDGG